MIFKHIAAIRRQETMTPQEVMAGLIWSRAVNSKDHFFKIPYYEFPCYLEYATDNEAFMVDVYYVGQEQAFSLLQPDYKSVLGASTSILDWLENQYAAVPPEAKPRKRKGGRMRGTNSRTSAPGSPPSQSARQPG